jgi:hypothetical protein
MTRRDGKFAGDTIQHVNAIEILQIEIWHVGPSRPVCATRSNIAIKTGADAGRGRNAPARIGCRVNEPAQERCKVER